MAGNVYGKFTVNLGAFVPEMQTEPEPERTWCQDYHCQLRKRLGELVPPHRADIWWSLDRVDAASADVQRCFEEYGLRPPWLDALSTRAAVLEQYRQHGRNRLGMAPAAPIEMGSLLLALGRDDEALAEFRAHRAEAHSHPAHHEFFAELLEQCGFSLD